jgi:hypothetical protein
MKRYKTASFFGNEFGHLAIIQNFPQNLCPILGMRGFEDIVIVKIGAARLSLFHGSINIMSERSNLHSRISCGIELKKPFKRVISMGGIFLNLGGGNGFPDFPFGVFDPIHDLGRR